MTGYLVLGIGFGIILKSKGFGLLWAIAMSGFIYAGSMQYIAINLLTGGASVITALLTTLAVNARHIFYGISMIDKYKNVGKAKPYLIFSLTDETYSIVCSTKNTDSNFYFFVSLFDHIYWVLGSVIGSVLGSVLKFNTQGIDFALTALFVTIFVEQWLDEKNHLPAIIGIVSTLICLIIFGRDSFLIPSMLLIAMLLTVTRKENCHE